MPYVSTKVYGHEVGLSCAFRQWRAQSHCKVLHGYALRVKLEFAAEELDSRNWVVDFGGLKSFKAILQDTFDHKLLVAQDDPYLEELSRLQVIGAADIVVLPSVGCEAFAKLIFNLADLWLFDNGYGERVTLRSVEVSEHGANSAIYKDSL